MIIREATAADATNIARVHVDAWRATYAGIVPADFLAQLSYESRERMWTRILSQGDTFTFVAEAAPGTVVGFANGGPERSGDPVYRGELYAIYLLPAHQGQGVGRALARTVAARLADNGFQSMLVWVLAANPARHFYAALGGRPVREQETEVGGARLSEVAYGWTDLEPLLRPA